MDAIKQIWSRVFSSRPEEGLSEFSAERWTLRNIVFLFSAALAALTAALFMAVGRVELGAVGAASTLGLLAAYALSRQGRRRAACMLAVGLLNAAILYSTQRFGTGMFEPGYLMSMSVAFLALEHEDRGLFYGVIALSLLLALMGEALWHARPMITLGAEARTTVRGLVHLVVSMHIGTVLACFLVSRNRMVARLHTAVAESEAANVAKSRFLANMSHEIRTPMNGVLGMLSILESTRLDEAQQSYIQIAHSSGHALLDIMNDVLDLSKVESGQLAILETAFNLRTLVEQVAQQAAIQSRERSLEIIAHYPPRIPARVSGDAGRIRQVLVNLVGNAVKFTPRGHVMISVSCEGMSDDAATLTLAVTDTGIGIPEQEQAAIFDKFKQVDTSQVRRQGGTGLGLAIVKELVTRMKGGVGVESRPGRGSTFWVRLPLALAGKASPSGSKKKLPRRSSMLRGARVLIVDDHPLSGSVLAEKLAHWGMQATTCTSGVEALEILQDSAQQGERHDMVIIDCRMPGMDGPTLACAIQRDPALHGVLMVMIAEMAEIIDPERVKATGCMGYMRKPLRQRELLDVLTRVWSSRPSAKEPRTRTRNAQVSAALPAPAFPGHVRVLVVEDNLVNRKVATRMLMRLGCHVDVAINGREALDLVDRASYAVVFMDIQMPEMDGLTATSVIREREAARGTHVPIVAMTAHAMAEHRERCLAVGMDAFVSKPIEQRRLAEVLTQLVHVGPALSGPRPDALALVTE